ncbi:RHS repeat-associated core domain-containing protein [Flavobacterium sp.]|uniref:RHS repeat domain-containing protein n=1 Tax=Flavobacterium sp. TaxID=239 RepID=UPI0022C4471B|nr:RHS repeat-associated core domain-containing protein [Flavobacterium sp.]MCZ8089033.1 hypothetical protein [Flavobacterium sp.]
MNDLFPQSQETFAEHSANENILRSWGLPTGKWTRVLANTTTQASAKKELSYTFYDYKSRPIRTYVTNNLSTTSYIQTDVKYDFEGKILETITRHKPSSDVAEITIRDYFTYSEQGRLLTHSNKVNNNSIQLLADNTYNELGQLIGKKVGNTVGSTPLQEVDYYYNIRGWLKSINDIAELGTDLFAFKLNYNEVENETNYEGKALYNGNIAETYWRTGKDDVKRKYGYFYDDLNRLTNAVYQRPNSSGIGVVTNAYNESLTYDKNGNIISLQRNGDIEEIAPALEIDDLDYVYKANTNELIKVTDNLTTSPSGFNDRANNTEEYGYDAHGNMTRDDNKGITDIRYNHLNLPIKITFGTQAEIAYVYNAEGKKLEKTVTQTGSTAVTTKYLDGFQYVDNVLQFFPHAEGYVKKNGNNYNYVFNYTDHLGNVRLSYSDLDKDGVLEQEERVVTVATDGSGNATEFFVSCIVEENNYYPFGLKHSGYNEGGFQASKYKGKFNGKEFQNELGLNLYDFHFRQYMQDIVRTTTQDPKSELFYSISPYSFLNNSPLQFIDPDGMKVTYGDFLDNAGHEDEGNEDDTDPPRKRGTGTSTGNMQGVLPSGLPDGVDLPAKQLDEVVIDKYTRWEGTYFDRNNYSNEPNIYSPMTGADPYVALYIAGILAAPIMIEAGILYTVPTSFNSFAGKAGVDLTTEIIANEGNIGNVNFISVVGSGFGADLITSPYSLTFNTGFKTSSFQQSIINYGTNKFNGGIGSGTKYLRSNPIFNSGAGQVYTNFFSIATQSATKSQTQSIIDKN